MSFIAASGDTGPRVDKRRNGGLLRTRVISALVLAPVALAAVHFGTPYFDFLVACVVIVMAWEWRRLCAGGRFDFSGYGFAAIVGAATALSSFGYFLVASAVVCAGALAVYAAGAIREHRPALWTGVGVFAVGIAGVALIAVRAQPEGSWLTFWLLATVWATDIAAYFTGRAIGGPKLAPSLSPGKTWAGLIGGVLAAGGWSVCWALWTDVSQPGTLAVLGMGTAVLAQLGDLGVSAVKRRFGAKDASNLIPGHGGLLDRADGFIGAAPFVALSIALAKGDMSLWA